MGLVPQGSYRQNTIIKPTDDDKEFDVDLLVVVSPIDGWSATDYLSHLANGFRDDGRYKDITDTHGKTRCVTIDYEGDFHVDLVPALFSGDRYQICNKKTNEFETSDGDGYAQWFDKQNAVANGHLVDVIKMVKHLRDSKGEFDTKSIILTTLLAMQVNEVHAAAGMYSDLYTTLNSILGSMDQYLQQFNEPPTVPNPAMPEEETFDRHWKDEKDGFVRLQNAISKYSTAVENAFASNDEAVIRKNLESVFDHNFFIDTNGVTGTPVGYHPTPTFEPPQQHAQLRR